MLIAVAIFFASFIQGSAGFGLALVAMPVLVSALGVRVASPVMALIGLAAGAILLVRYRDSLAWRTVIRLIIPACAAIPLGVYLLRYGDSPWATRILGVFIISYALYALFSPQLPALESERWTYFFGALSGLFTGAYAVGGPPVVILGTCRGWTGARFKSNLQAFFFVTGLFLLSTHVVNRNITPDVWRHFLLALPSTILGLFAGFALDPYLKPERFRVWVLLLLLALGVGLLVQSS